MVEQRRRRSMTGYATGGGATSMRVGVMSGAAASGQASVRRQRRRMADNTVDAGAAAPTSSSSAAASPGCAPPSSWRAAGASLDPHEGRPRPRATPATRRAASPRHRRRRQPRRCTAADTIRAGDGLCDEAAVRVLVEEAPRYVRELDRRGARAFDREPTARSRSAREAAHSVRRVLHAARCDGPRDRPRALGARAARCRACACASITRRHRAARRRRAAARRRVLRPSGAPREVDAPGHAARDRRRRAGLQRDDEPGGRHRRRHRARRSAPGARVADLEFVQFHPTALDCARRAAVSDVRGAARRRRAADQRRRRAVHDALPRRRRSRAARLVSRAHRPRSGAHRRPGVPVAAASRPGLRARAVPDHRRDLPRRSGSISRATGFRSARPRTT